jgi:hypothetical protein
MTVVAGDWLGWEAGIRGCLDGLLGDGGGGGWKIRVFGLRFRGR